VAMNMTGSDGVLSVPAEHVLGLVCLVAAPVAVCVLVCAARVLAARGNMPAAHLVRRLAELPVTARAALFADLVGAGVHAALVTTHWTEDRTRSLLFLLDAMAFVVAMAWTVSVRRGWRVVNVALLAGTVVAYAYYLLTGRETLDLVGLLTTSIELSAAFVLLDPRQSAVGSGRRRDRLVVAAALPVALVCLLGTGAVAAATTEVTPGQPHQHHNHPGRRMANMPGMGNMPGMTSSTPGRDTERK
jgi:hypothetical protein